MKRTKDELVNSFKEVIGDASTDAAIAFLEDLSDSMNTDTEDWKAKYEECDRSWREKYVARFTGSEDPALPDSNVATTTTETAEVETEDEPLTFDALFTTEE